jgi:hypothetical protein
MGFSEVATCWQMTLQQRNAGVDLGAFIVNAG